MTDELAGFPAVSIAQCNAMLTAPDAKFEMDDTLIGGVTYKTYKNAPPTLREVMMAGMQWPDRDFLVFQDERVTFQAHFKAVAHFAHVLKDRFNVQKGDRVAVVGRNYPQWSVAFHGALMAGAIATPLNSWWTGEELEYGLSDSGTKVAIVDVERLERLREHMHNLPDLEHVIVARSTGDEEGDPRFVAMESLIGGANSWTDLADKSLPEVSLDADDDATIMYTSGTTGKPKGALSSHRAIISGMFNSLACQARSFLRKGEAPPEPQLDDPQKAALISIPFFHATGAFAILLPAHIRGAKVVTQYKWDAGEALGIIEREKINSIGGVPAIAWQVLEHPDRSKYDLSSIEAVSYGGAPSAPELVSTIHKTFKSADVGNGWGMTETCATSTLNFGLDYIKRPKSAGAGGPATEMKIVDPDGKVLPTGEVGELWFKGPNNAKLYWNKPEATAKTFVDGWVVTGDLGYLDDEGFLFLVDRAKDMLIRGGENIYCSEVENTLYAHPDIMDAAVVGIPHKVLGEEVGAVVQVKPGSTPPTVDAVRAFVAEHIAAFKVPKTVVFMTEPLPRNANGKILKNELKELFVSSDT